GHGMHPDGSSRRRRYLPGRRPGAPQRLVHHAGTGYSQSRPITTTDSTPSKKRSLLRKLLYAAAAVILLGSLLASYMNWEANHLEFSENTAPAGCVPGLSGLRILVLSDVHTNLPLLEKAAAMAEQARPDMIVFLGDLYTDFLRATHAGDYITQMKRLSSIAPAYACLGNHDMALVDNVERILKEGGFTLLRNSAAFVTIPRLGNAEFKLVGLGDLREGDFFPDRCMSPRELGEESVMPTIVLSHNPKGRELLGGYHWNLMLSGHTHGGQIKLPFFSTPLLTSEGETMYSGFHPYEDKQVFVTRGIGYIGPGRFNCPPEINLITIP
ncbi:MAG: phosphodiesterase YaeI, partial [Akkermansia sp.]|nr:phosphodiesterase YaeI [Akkermansia sp.]